MDFARMTQDTRQDRVLARAKEARKWARLVQVCLLGTCVTAIWQDRALAPPVHDQLKFSAAWAGDMLESTQGAKSYLTAMSGFSGNGNQSEFDPITEALLKMRN
jgi:hypothetical protein